MKIGEKIKVKLNPNFYGYEFAKMNLIDGNHYTVKSFTLGIMQHTVIFEEYPDLRFDWNQFVWPL